METIALVLGIIAVVFYLLGYLQKKRKNIILYNILSRVLFIGQYLLLRAFEGAVLDVAAIIPSLFAQKKDTPFVKKNLSLFVIGGNLLIIASGLLVYEDIFSILPILGVMLHTSALWITDEKIIRRVLLLGCPLCFTYNFVRGAYGSCIGDVLSSISLITAMLRYDYNFSEKTTLLLIRHGESEANKEKVFGGHYDVNLIENGIRQAELTAKYISENYKVDKIYASDLKRAYKTAECVAEKVNVSIIKEPKLREIDGGKWEAIKYSELNRLYPEEFDIWKNHTGKARCTGGESVEELGERIMGALAEIAKENAGKTVVIATHATPVRVTQCLVQTKNLDEMGNIPWVSNASVTELFYQKGKWKLGKIGEDKHLSELRTSLPTTV